jgi:hypothetical protein
VTAGFPPEPWQLRGQLTGWVFLVPLDAVPAALPPGCRPIRLGGWALLSAAFVSYEPGGVLTYSELLVTLLVRLRRRIIPSITHIWVDSAASREGGRSLWGIPKELATFDIAAGHLSAGDAAGRIASATVGQVRWLPGRWPIRFRIVQALGAASKVSPVRVRARVGLSRAQFRAAPDHALRFLAGRRPLLSLSLGDFRMRFGRG